MFLIAITLGLCLAYVVLFFLFPFFFQKKGARLTTQSLRSVVIIILTSLVGYGVALSIEDPEISNRVLHGFGGGFMGFLVCFLAARDSELKVGIFQFLLFSALVVTALGVANEIYELFLFQYFGIVLAKSPMDTGLDLLSNTIGIIVASVSFAPFIRRRNSRK